MTGIHGLWATSMLAIQTGRSLQDCAEGVQVPSQNSPGGPELIGDLPGYLRQKRLAWAVL
jgi:hypothetical protein